MKIFAHSIYLHSPWGLTKTVIGDTTVQENNTNSPRPLALTAIGRPHLPEQGKPEMAQGKENKNRERNVGTPAQGSSERLSKKEAQEGEEPTEPFRGKFGQGKNAHGLGAYRQEEGTPPRAGSVRSSL